MALDDILFQVGFAGPKSDEFKGSLGPFHETMERVLKKVRPLAGQDDQNGFSFSNNEIQQASGVTLATQEAAKAGLIGMTSSFRDNQPHVLAVMWYELLGGAHSPAFLTQMLTDDVIQVLDHFASEEIKQKHIPDMIEGKSIGAMIMTEPEAGSDVGRIMTKASHLDGKTYMLNGEKCFITNPHADVALVLARMEETYEQTKGTINGLGMFLVPKIFDGERNHYTIERVEKKMGLHASPTGTIRYGGAKAILIGAPGNGIHDFFNLMNFARVGIAAQAVGISQAALDYAFNYAANQRTITGEKDGSKQLIPLVENPTIKSKLIGMEVKIEAARALVYAAAQMLDEQKGLDKEIAKNERDDSNQKICADTENMLKAYVCMAKYLAPTLGEEIATQAVQILGGAGYTQEHPVERYMRDMKIISIYEGTTEIQAKQLANMLYRGDLKINLELMVKDLQKRHGGTSKKLVDLIGRFSSQIDSLKVDKNKELRDSQNMAVADTLSKIFATYLLIRQSEMSPKKAMVADIFYSIALENQTNNLYIPAIPVKEFSSIFSDKIYSPC